MIFLILSQNQKKKIDKSILNKVNVIENDNVEYLNSRLNRLKTFIYGKNIEFENLLIKFSIDCVFEAGFFLGKKFKIPIISWIPDFQHKHLSHLFSKYELFIFSKSWLSE